MSVMHTNLGGMIRVSNHMPSGDIEIAKGKEARLWEIAKRFGEPGIEDPWALYVPFILPMPQGAEGYFDRKNAINAFARFVAGQLVGAA